MKSRLFLYVLAVMAIGMAVVSCSKDSDSIPDVKYTVLLEMPINLDTPTLKSATVTLTDIKGGASYTVTDFVADGSKYKASITVPQGTYNIKVDGSIQYMVSGTPVTGGVQATREGVAVSVELSSADVVLAVYNAKSGFVIEEIFFTGTLTPAGKQYSGDQYFKITNNSAQALYADGLAIVESAFLTVSKYSYTPDIMSQAMTVDAFYCIPGNGKDVLVEPGKSLIIALNAVNHTVANSNSFDLSNADFEFYDVSSNPNFLDTDNDKVPNLDKWYCNTASYFSLHNRGFKSYALVKPEIDKATFIKDYEYTANYIMELPSGNYEMSTKGYKVPNAWIVDAVNLSIASKFEWIVTSAKVDAGWTYCGKVDGDKTRYSKSVRRKVERVDSGRNILKDTNDSSADFEAEAVPSLKK